jgi:hypothetical protein
MSIIYFSDPIFAIIKQHRALSLAYYVAISNPLVGSFGTDQAVATAEKIADDACEALSDHADVLISTQPTTIEGVAAVMRYVAGLKLWELPSSPGEAEGDSSWQSSFLNNLADAIESISNTEERF